MQPLQQALQGLPLSGVQWNERQVADWMAQLIGRPVSRQRGWEYLKQMDFRFRVPRAEHIDSSLEEQAEWKKMWRVKSNKYKKTIQTQR